MIPSAPLGTDAAAGRLGLGAAAGAGPSGAAAERRFRFELAAHPGSPAQARRLTRARLTGWSVCEDTCDTATLVISELVTNAIVHTASSHVVCELLDHDDLLRIAVRDEGCAPGEPHQSPRRPEEEHGRGLLLIEALCRAWGAHESGTGLLVWAELPRGEGAEASGGAHGTGAASGQDGARGDLGWGPRPKPTTSGTPGGPCGPGGPDGAATAGGPRTAEGSHRTAGPLPAADRGTDEVHGRGADEVHATGTTAAPAADGEAAARRHGFGEALRQGVAQLRNHGLGVGRPRSAGTEWG